MLNVKILPKGREVGTLLTSFDGSSTNRLFSILHSERQTVGGSLRRGQQDIPKRMPSRNRLVGDGSPSRGSMICKSLPCSKCTSTYHQIPRF